MKRAQGSDYDGCSVNRDISEITPVHEIDLLSSPDEDDLEDKEITNDFKVLRES
jgi:hypothetical protein